MIDELLIQNKKRLQLLFIIFILVCFFPIQSSANTDEKKSLKKQTKAQKAFEDSLNQLIPLNSTQQIKVLDKKQEKKKILMGQPPVIKNRTVNIRPEPGLQPVKLITLVGYGTGVLFMDQTGSPWPIDHVVPGSDQSIELTEPDENDKDNNFFTFNSIEHSGHTNISVKLSGLTIPLMFQTITENNVKKSPAIDGIVTIRLQKRGPKALPPIIEKRPEDPANEKMISYLDGVPPEGAIKIKDISNLQVYKEDNKLFLRTAHPLIWPAWNAVIRGMLNTRVYELNLVDSMLVSINGEIKTIDLK